jgi:hypothetical protein
MEMETLCTSKPTRECNDNLQLEMECPFNCNNGDNCMNHQVRELRKKK